MLFFLFVFPFPFLSLHVSAFFLCFIILACFRRFFLSTFPVEFPILVLIFFYELFEGIPIFSQTNFAPIIIIIIIIIFSEFSHQCKLMSSRLSLSDSKCPQVSRTLLSVLADLDKALVAILKAPITISINVILMFHSFSFSWQGPATYTYSIFFPFYSVACRGSNVYNSASSLFLLTVIRSGRLAEMGESFISQNPIGVSGLRIYYLFA